MTDTATKTLSSIYIDHLKKFAAKINRFGANVIVFDSADQCIVNAPAGQFESDADKLAEFARMARQDPSQGVQRFGDFQQILALPLTEGEDITNAVVVIDPGNPAVTNNRSVKKFCSQYDIDPEVLETTINKVTHDVDYLAEILNSFATELRYSTQATQQLEMVSTELAQTYEELILLYNLSTNMKVTQSDANYLQMACDQLTQLISVEGIAIFLEKNIETSLFSINGKNPFEVLGNLAIRIITKIILDLGHGRRLHGDYRPFPTFSLEDPDNHSAVSDRRFIIDNRLHAGKQRFRVGNVPGGCDLHFRRRQISILDQPRRNVAFVQSCPERLL